MTPHKLDLYRLAVQHPEAEAALLARIYFRHRRAEPARLKEDFAGTAAIAAAWVIGGEHRRAIAVDRHEPTLRWAWRRAQRELGPRAEDLHLVSDDVVAATRRSPPLPRVDVVAALNFSSLYWHDRQSLHNYFRAARRSLRPRGILIIDVFGGPGAMRTGEQRRLGRPDPRLGIEPFEYRWEQRSYDALTGRIDCRVHFALADGRVIRNAFRYDWRLWTLPELTEAMLIAGFAETAVWCDGFDARTGRSDGRYAPVRQLPAREDWIAYVVGMV